MRPTIEQPAGVLLADANLVFVELAPLLEEKRNIDVGALIPERPEPIRIAWPGVRAALATGDYPVNPRATKMVIGDSMKAPLEHYGTDQRLCRNKCRLHQANTLCLMQIRQSFVSPLLILN